ncbi:calmodulin-interacting protein 111 [Selaginella moellendorffii]|uniref:calmodulin-interacting protein 111 n=1 Tax=Selaginella moellendorffii TaxID=88036 RepID=UPI000D1C615A|nr:calmodulin-interacting protein 111 [Selaginella moellendorffii]|eukprot:XP_024534829.1 calmodulin-interacting protein 111 [Selaginella moellendorffii]
MAFQNGKLVKNNVRLSSHLSQTLGCPALGSVLLISSLRATCRSRDIANLLHLPRSGEGECVAAIQECKHLSLQICQGSFSFALEHSELERESAAPSSPFKVSPFKGSPLKTPPPAKSTTGIREISSAAARSYLTGGSSKMKEVIEKLAARWLSGRLLLVGNMVTVPVCGSDCVFHVKAAESLTSQELDLSEKLQGLSLQANNPGGILYFTNHKTTVNIELDEESVLKESDTVETRTRLFTETTSSYSSLGGLAEEIETLKEIVQYSLLKPETLARYCLKRTKGVLLYGPPGTGKTSLAQAVAKEAGVKMLVINGPEIVTEYHGESEAAMKAIFDSAAREAPSVVFIDELDAITPQRREGSEGLGQRLMATLLTSMDGVHQNGVLVIAATNRPESIDPALRRHGRFDYEIEIGVPTPKGRLEILQVHLSRLKHTLSSEDVQALASATHGFVGADLSALCNEAALGALRRHVHSKTESASSLSVGREDFELAREKIRPSAMREVILEVPKVRWSDIGGQSAVKQQLKEIVEWPHKHQDSFARIGTTPPRGVLLYGPPGCSKTMMARAVAAETGLNFIAVKGPELFSKWVGESEKAVRALFARAKAAAPSVVFFDEIDGLAVTRSSGGGGTDGISVEDRVMSQLLIEMDGVSPRNGVSVIAATNRPDKLDPALLRPGRFDRLIYVGPPDKAARQQIFEIHMKNTPCKADVSVDVLASYTESYTGADIAAVCREAALAALEDDLDSVAVGASHFDVALTRVLPSKYSTRFGKFQTR